MGKQINYWLGYSEFLQIAHTALDCGCLIIKQDSEELIYGKTLDTVTVNQHRYYFYLPEAGCMQFLDTTIKVESIFPGQSA